MPRLKTQTQFAGKLAGLFPVKDAQGTPLHPGDATTNLRKTQLVGTGVRKLYVPVHALERVSRYTGAAPESAPRHKLGGDQWSGDETPPDVWRKLLSAIVGFELEIQAWRPTLKLSQNKSPEDRARISAGLQAAGSPALAELIRTLAP